MKITKDNMNKMIKKMGYLDSLHDQGFDCIQIQKAARKLQRKMLKHNIFIGCYTIFICNYPKRLRA